MMLCRQPWPWTLRTLTSKSDPTVQHMCGLARFNLGPKDLDHTSLKIKYQTNRQVQMCCQWLVSSLENRGNNKMYSSHLLRVYYGPGEELSAYCHLILITAQYERRHSCPHFQNE